MSKTEIAPTTTHAGGVPRRYALPVLALAISGGFDLATTYAGLQAGFYEANPIARNLIHLDGYATFILMRVFIVAFAGLTLTVADYYTAKPGVDHDLSWSARLGCYTAAAIWFTVAAWNTVLLATGGGL